MTRVIQGIKDSNSTSERILTLVTMRLIIWMMPCVALPLSERRHCEGERHDESISLYCGKLKSVRVRCRVLFKAFSFSATYHYLCHRDLVCVPGYVGGGNPVCLGNRISSSLVQLILFLFFPGLHSEGGLRHQPPILCSLCMEGSLWQCS